MAERTKGPRFSSRHPRGGSQPSITAVLGDPMPSSDLHKYRASIWYTDIHASKNTYTNEIKIFRKREDFRLAIVVFLVTNFGRDGQSVPGS